MSLLEEFYKEYDEDWFDRCMRLRNDFMTKYSIENIKSLSLEDYCWTGHRSTFCYRLEHELKPLSSMGDMHIDGYGVYIDRDNHPRVYRSLKKDYGDDYKRAFAFEKEEIVRLLKAGAENDYASIKKSKIQQQFRFKLLSVYYPDSFFPVCALPTAREYCNCLGINATNSLTMTELNCKLIQQSKDILPSEWTLYHAMAFCEWLRNNHKKLDDSFISFNDAKIMAESIENEIEKMHLVGETREAVVKQRVNQGVFRDKLLSKYKKCKLCQVDCEKLLVASHIKPWSDSSPEERLDVDNGFLMCPNHDRLFDRGYISFADDGEIMISSKLTEKNRVFLNVRADDTVELTQKNRLYLKYHRENIFLE